MAMARIPLPLFPDETDHISKLPVEILCLILSDLPIKEVVRTSVLSKRFRFVWTWIPRLNLDPQQMIPESMRAQPLTLYHGFSASYNLLWLMKNHQGEMRRLDIVHSLVHGWNRLPRCWLSMIRGGRVISELSLTFEPLEDELEADMDLPAGIFHELFCLHTLELSKCAIRDVEAFMGCTNLKNVTLNEVNVSSHSLSWVISQCSNLETLRMKTVGWLNDLKVHAEKLEVLEIFQMELSSIDIQCENLRVLALDNFFCNKSAITMNKMSIIVPKVEYLRIHNYLEAEDEFLYEYEIEDGFDASDKEGDRYGKKSWFQVFENVALLLSRINQPKPYLELQNTKTYNTNPFENIKELLVHINVNGTSGAVSLINAFKHCINLQMLSITVEVNSVVLDSDLPYPQGTFWEYVEGCVGVEEELRNVRIENFTGRDLEVGLVRFLASRAKKLQRMVIVHRREWGLSRAESYFVRNLRNMPKANKNASIKFQF